MNQLLRTTISIIALVSILGALPARSFSVPVMQDESIELVEGTPLNVATAQEISSKTANAGDPVDFKVEEDVSVNGHVLIARGTLAKGSVINAEPSGHMGKSGKLGIAIASTKTVDGQPIKLRAAKGQEGKDKTSSTLALSMLVSEFFLLKKGTEAKIAQGTHITVYVAEEKRFHISGGTIVADSSPTPAKTGPVQAVTVFVYRPDKMAGGALEPSVFCDDVELARMDNGRYFALRLPSGKHMIHMTDKKKGFLIDMGPGETYYFRVGVEAGMWKGHGKLTLEDAQKALPEIKKIKFIGKDKIKDQTMIVELDPNKPAP
jgi:hypothetical protein